MGANFTVFNFSLLQKNLSHSVIASTFGNAVVVESVKPAVTNVSPRSLVRTKVNGDHGRSRSVLWVGPQSVDGLVRFAAQLIQRNLRLFQFSAIGMEDRTCNFDDFLGGLASPLVTTGTIGNHSKCRL